VKINKTLTTGITSTDKKTLQNNRSRLIRLAFLTAGLSFLKFLRTFFFFTIIIKASLFF
jgi:hypothetical protein